MEVIIVIALLNCGAEGKKGFVGNDCGIPGVKAVTSEQCEGRSFCTKIQPPTGLEKYCPVEYLYSKEVLDSYNMLTKRNYNEFTHLIGFTSPEESEKLSEEYKNETSLRPFKVNDDKKNSVSEAIQCFSEPIMFESFKQTLELIKAIISR